ncbi:MAG: anti-sigma factor domain-containing protein [Solirubrobacteraceae bacterium]
MSPASVKHERADCAGDAAAYALGALEPLEAIDFEDHLTDCIVCRDELGAYRHVTEALPMAAPQVRVPVRLRRRVMHATRAGSEPAPRRVRPRIALAGALAMAAIAAGVGLQLGSSELPARMIQASVSSPAATAQLRIIGSRGELSVHGLPAPPPGQIYEVWLRYGRAALQATSALFSVTTGGEGVVDVPGSLRSVDQVMVTREPAGGSVVPTSAPIIVATLT